MKSDERICISFQQQNHLRVMKNMLRLKILDEIESISKATNFTSTFQLILKKYGPLKKK
jgi:hypothetical protein